MDGENITRKLQNKGMEMLRELSDIFEKNGIRFYLACGTALGCVRHEGFIPWDDDIDIYIMGKDYEKLRTVFLTQDTGNLQFQDYSTVENYPYTFPKIVAKDTVLVEDSLKHLDYKCGVYIDIFPLMEIEDNWFVRQMKEFIRYYRYCLLKAYYFEFSSSVKKIINKIVRQFVSPKKVQEKLYKMYTKEKLRGNFLIDIGAFGSNALIKRQSFKDVIKMTFEDAEMPMPIGYDQYLQDYYGDYMKLPREEDRVSRHHIARLEL